MSGVSIAIATDNAAFEDGNDGTEVARILRELADALDGNDLTYADGVTLHDYNGNSVGTVSVR